MTLPLGVKYRHELKLINVNKNDANILSNFDLGLGIKVIQNIAQSPLHHVAYHVAYAPAKFEVATYNCLGDAITRKNNICP